MAITLTPEQEQTVRQDAKALGYENINEYLAERLQSLHHQDQYFAEHQEEFSRMIDEGLDAIDRGELFSAEEAKAQVAAMKQEALTRLSAA